MSGTASEEGTRRSAQGPGNTCRRPVGSGLWGSPDKTEGLFRCQQLGASFPRRPRRRQGSGPKGEPERRPPRLLSNGLGSARVRHPTPSPSSSPARTSGLQPRPGRSGPRRDRLPTTPPAADRRGALSSSLRTTPPLQPLRGQPSAVPLASLRLDPRTPEAVLTVGDVAPHLILGHDQVLGDSLLLLLVLARHLPAATNTAALFP